MLDNETIELARAALERPSDFAYSGDLPLFETWGLCGPSTHRDASALDASNYEIIAADLRERFPDDVETVSASHWGHGWVDQLAIRVLAGDYQPALPADWQVTDAFRAVIDWRDALADYPVADDADYSRREHEELVSTIEAFYSPVTIERDGIEYEIRDIETYGEDLARVAFDEFSACRAEELPDDEAWHDAAIRAGVYVPDIESVREVIAEADAQAASALDIAERIAAAALDGDRETVRRLTREMADDFSSDTAMALVRAS